MCGIFGAVGAEDAYNGTRDGLVRLAYRGYDSAGVATLNNKEIEIWKAMGHPESLPIVTSESETAIGHTRWASHGVPSEMNAHPHISNDKKIALVHNGIIENYSELKKFLVAEGYDFYSDTDTEVLPNLLQYYISQGNDLEKSILELSAVVRGAYAIAFLHEDYPKQINVVRLGSPLWIGKSDKSFFISSDMNSLPMIVNKAQPLDNGKMAFIRKNSLVIKDLSGKRERPKFNNVKIGFEGYSKSGYEHYMEKEVFEQPDYLKMSIAGRVIANDSLIKLSGISDDLGKIMDADEIVYTGCGSAFYAAKIGAQAMESIARKKTRAVPAGELQYLNPVITDKTVLVVVSQSGETADTIRCIERYQEHGATVIGVVNVVNSTISNLVSSGIHIRAGQEISVASTKAVTNQIMIMVCMAALIASKRDLSPITYGSFIEECLLVPHQIEKVLSRASEVKEIARKYADRENMFCIGRAYLEPIAREAALKIKEIAYIHAEGYSAAELKHGPLALISDDCFTLALVDSSPLGEKMLSNIREIKSRSGQVIVFAEESAVEKVGEFADEIFVLPDVGFPSLKVFTFLIASQLFSYYLAKERNCEIDRPRNLAKSVTIE